MAPTFPVSNDGPRFLLLAVVGSLGAGIALAVCSHRARPMRPIPRSRCRATWASTLFARCKRCENIVVVAPIPKRRRRWWRRSDYSHERVAAFPPGAPVQFVITSAGPGEGKSLVAANLLTLLRRSRRPGAADRRRHPPRPIACAVRCAAAPRPGRHPDGRRRCLGDAAPHHARESTPTPSGSRRQRGPEHCLSELVVDAARQGPAALRRHHH